jgi:hypothetical protein
MEAREIEALVAQTPAPEDHMAGSGPWQLNLEVPESILLLCDLDGLTKEAYNVEVHRQAMDIF